MFKGSLIFGFCEKPFNALSNLTVSCSAAFRAFIDGSELIALIRRVALCFWSLNTCFYGWILFVGAITQLIAYAFGVHIFSASRWMILAYILAIIFGVIGIRANLIILAFFNKSMLRRLIESATGESLRDNNILRYMRIFTRVRCLTYGSVIGLLLSLATLFIPKLYIIVGLVGFIMATAILNNYIIGVYLIAATAVIAPTMACVGLILFTYAAFFLQCLYRGRPFIKLTGSAFYVLIFLVVYAVYAFTSLTPVASVKIWLIIAVFISSYFLIINAASSAHNLRWLLTVICGAGLLVAGYGVYQYFFGSDLMGAWIDKDMFYESTVRVYSTLQNPNVLGEYLLLFIPIAVAMLWTRKNLLSRVAYVGVIGVAFVCMLMTQSRGCWLGLMLAAFVYIVLVKPRLLPYGILALLVLMFVLPSSYMNRFLSIGNLEDTSTSYRYFIWLGTLNMLRDFGMYGLGLGGDAFNKIYPFYAYSSVLAPHSHNLYLQLLSEMGVAGLTAFVLMTGNALYKSLRGFLAYRKTFFGPLCAALIAGMLGFLLQGAFDYVFYNYRVFLMFMITVALCVAANNVAHIEQAKQNA